MPGLRALRYLTLHPAERPPKQINHRSCSGGCLAALTRPSTRLCGSLGQWISVNEPSAAWIRDSKCPCRLVDPVLCPDPAWPGG